jgi:hypothetical protein
MLHEQSPGEDVYALIPQTLNSIHYALPSINSLDSHHNPLHKVLHQNYRLLQRPNVLLRTGIPLMEVRRPTSLMNTYIVTVQSILAGYLCQEMTLWKPLDLVYSRTLRVTPSTLRHPWTTEVFAYGT